MLQGHVAKKRQYMRHFPYNANKDIKIKYNLIILLKLTLSCTRFGVKCYNMIKRYTIPNKSQ